MNFSIKEILKHMTQEERLRCLVLVVKRIQKLRRMGIEWRRCYFANYKRAREINKK